MKSITIRISDRDFADMIRHIAKEKPGRPLVAVMRLDAVDGDDDFDLLDAQAEAEDILAGLEPERRR